MKLRTPDFIRLLTETEDETFSGGCTEYKDISIRTELCGEELRLYVTAVCTPLRYVALRFNYLPEERRTDPVRVLGDTIERGYGDLEWRSIVPERATMWTVCVSNGSDCVRDYTGRFTECFGVKVRPNALCTWQYDTKGVTLWADLRCGGMGVNLAGRTLHACTVRFGEYREISAFEAVKNYYKTLCDDPLPVEHIIYGSNNWYYAYGHSSHEEILADADILAANTVGLKNRPFMVIDDGWQPNSCDAPWDCGNERFPDMKRLADEIAERGCYPGIWVRYLADRKGDLHTPESWRSPLDKKMLDVSHPAVLEYVKETTRRICDWGYKLIKHDYSTFDILGYDMLKRDEARNVKNNWHFFDTSKTSAEIVKNYYKAILDATEGRAYVLGCNVIGHLSAGLCHANRTGDDTSGYAWERTRQMGVNTLAFRLVQNRAFFVADPDCIGITEYIDWKLNREWLRLLAVSGSSLFMSCKPGTLDEAQYAEIKDALARNSEQKDELQPLDWMENVCPEHYLLDGEELTFDWFGDCGADLKENAGL